MLWRTRRLPLADPSRPHWRAPERPRPVPVTVWQPTAGAGPYPVILLSHGTGGAAAALSWLATELAAAGFLVAGVDHHGNTYVEPPDPRGFARWWDRARDLSVALDAVLAGDHDADPRRVGAAGFSLGGYTVAALLGARIDEIRYRAVADGAVPPPPEYPDLLTDLRAVLGPAGLARLLAECVADVRDARVRAGLLLAPALAPALDPASLAAISAPVRVLWGDADTICPPPANAHAYLAGIPGASGASLGPDVGHYAFTGTDTPGEPAAAANRRRVAQAAAVAEARAFFQVALPTPRPAGVAESEQSG
ncbi:MAG TPA: alpha/beta hydrolase [Pilimelia sp.]|nr:alpha/beta hydrolase [Pilimelia sp.]